MRRNNTKMTTMNLGSYLCERRSSIRVISLPGSHENQGLPSVVLSSRMPEERTRPSSLRGVESHGAVNGEFERPSSAYAESSAPRGSGVSGPFRPDDQAVVGCRTRSSRLVPIGVIWSIPAGSTGPNSRLRDEDGSSSTVPASGPAPCDRRPSRPMVTTRLLRLPVTMIQTSVQASSRTGRSNRGLGWQRASRGCGSLH